MTPARPGRRGWTRPRLGRLVRPRAEGEFVRFRDRPSVGTLIDVVGALSLMDDDGTEVVLDECEADSLLAVTGNLERATVSACPDCRSRVLAAVALVDVLDDSPPFVRGSELVDLADDAPTLHLYAIDLLTECEHERWRDPLFDEWCEVAEAPGPHARR